MYSGLAPLGMPSPEVAPENFVQILERVWWRLDRALDRDTLRASAEYYVANALLAGTTTLIDHHESPGLIHGSLDILGDVCESLGIRAALCYGATERNHGRDEARAGLMECRRFAESRTSDTLKGMVALHAAFTVSDETIGEALALAASAGLPFHVHLAEDRADVVDSQSRGYSGPLERILGQGELTPHSLLVHGIHITPQDVTCAREMGAYFVQNPRSNEGNGVGYPIALKGMDRVALGTDGYPAQMDEEEEALKRLATVHGDDLASVGLRLDCGREIARAIFGPAVDDDQVVFQDGKLDKVVVGGRVVVDGGSLAYGDIGAIRKRAQLAADTLWRKMASL
jgi:cytosine/adenosine deaminase-related metal-dependent hydrolase